MTVMCFICQEWFEVDDDEFFAELEDNLSDNLVNEMVCPECAEMALDFWNIKQN